MKHGDHDATGIVILSPLDVLSLGCWQTPKGNSSGRP
jgi:hypothetical protein